MTREPRTQSVKGTYELHFPDRFYGHYIWYVPFEATGPTPDAPSTKTQHTRAMTDREKARHCGWPGREPAGARPPQPGARQGVGPARAAGRSTATA
ncbi:hypothetical protein [Streptomyces sp. NPDC005322]|uniref:hypothetical protein n=1 Tax=Streptomyces sp. NPDC005322 TaxID=3157032 RepID=UPI0033BC707A